MQCARDPWVQAFTQEKHRNLKTSYNMLQHGGETGVMTCTCRVYWELQDAEDWKAKQSRESEMASGLIRQNFTLNTIFTNQRTQLAIHDCVDPEHEMTAEERDQEAEAVLTTRIINALKASKLWDQQLWRFERRQHLQVLCA